MKKYILAFSCIVALGAQAQNAYTVEQVGGTDLGGTARFVGMGGAMNALGADLSTMGGNPAAIGLYRRSDASFTASVLGQPDALSYGNQSRVRGSFDQAGLVYTLRTGSAKVPYFNFGFNYQKSRNLKSYLGSNWIGLGNISQLHQLADHLAGAALGYVVEPSDPNAEVDYPYYNSLIANGAYDAGLIDMEITDGVCTSVYAPATSEAYRYTRANWGHVNEYDINLSANIKDRLYLGLTAGIYDVNIGSNLYYEEILQDEPRVSYGVAESSRIRGTGFDVKFGAIFRPSEDSPFRMGLALHTPRLLSLSVDKGVQFDGDVVFPCTPVHDALYTDRGNRDYIFRTPWRVQLSAATTVSDWLALDAEYEAAMYKGGAIKYPTMYNYDGASLVGGDRDLYLDDEIDATLRTQHTIRLGAEARFAKNFYARIGYNWVSAPIQKGSFLHLAPAITYGDECEIPNCTYNATSTDAVNLGATNRLSLGLGWHGKRFYADVAYTCQNQSAEVVPFSVPEYNTDVASPDYGRLTGVTTPAAFNDAIVRHTGVFTVGVRF